MGRKLTKAPVFFVVAQARFNSILALDSYAPQIQDKLRLQGFPDSQKSVMATFNLNLGAPGDANPAQVPVAQTARYLFSDIERMSGFTLEQSSLSFQTTAYETFESFSRNFIHGLQTIHEVVTLGFTDRIGIRYLDAIHPEGEKKIDFYLNNNVLGLYGKVNGPVHAFTETFAKSGTISVISRTIIQDGVVGVPPDLQPFTLVLPERLQNRSGNHAILDNDAFHEGRDVFDLSRIEAHLSEAHSAVTETFKATVTEGALKSWE